jgi:hypothetical protein
MKLKDWRWPNTFTRKAWPGSWGFHGIWLLRFAFAFAFLCKCYAMSTEDVFKATRSAVVEIVTQDKSGSTLGIPEPVSLFQRTENLLRIDML